MASHQPSNCTSYGVFCLLWLLITAFQYGYHISALNQISGVLTCRSPPEAANPPVPTRYGLPACIPLSDSAFSAVTAIFTVGGLFGSLLAGPLAAGRGRRTALSYASILTLLGASLTAAAPATAALLIGRALVGIAAGIGVASVPIYLAELAPPARKGAIGTLFQLSIAIGILATQILGLRSAHAAAKGWERGDGRGTWRAVPLASAGLALVQLLLTHLVVESPSWLEQHGKKKEARAVRARLWVCGSNVAYEGVVQDEGHEDEYDHRRRSDSLDVERSSPRTHLLVPHAAPLNSFTALSLFALLRSRDLRIPLLVVAFAMVAQQLSGINAIMYYSNAILSKTQPAFAPYVSLGVACMNVAMTLPSVILIERMGRRALLNASMLGAGMSLLAVGYALDSGLNALASFGIITYVAAFACGLGPVPFVIISDIGPCHAVSALSSAALSLNWIMNVLVGLVFLPLRNALAHGDPMRGGRIFYVFVFALTFSGIAFNVVFREVR